MRLRIYYITHDEGLLVWYEALHPGPTYEALPDGRSVRIHAPLFDMYTPWGAWDRDGLDTFRFELDNG
jgi:hypothetical protein